MTKKLIEASQVTGEILANFVDYLEQKYKINRFKATILAGTLIESVKQQIEENQETAKDIQEVIEDLPTCE